MNNPAISVLVIGAGMYVGGRGAGTDGTVLPALMHAQSQGMAGEILVAATAKDSIDALQVKLSELNARLGTNVKIQGYPDGPNRDTSAYKHALSKLPKPACAIVVVPDHLHTEVTSDVIRAGVHPLVVKPLTPTVNEALQLMDLADQHHVYGAVEFHKRWDESNLLLRQSISDGKLGDMRYITVEYSQRRMMRGVFNSWVDLTNIFQYLGVHYVDLVHFVTRAMPIRALATGQPQSSKPGVQPGADSIQAIIEWEALSSRERFISTIATNWIDPDNTSAMSDQKITVVGTKGRYQMDQKNRGAQLVTQESGVEDVNPYFSQIYVGGEGKIGVHGYGPQSILQFLSDIKDITSGATTINELIPKRPSFKESLVSTAVIEAVNESLNKNGEWVGIDSL